ncbi:MAG: 1-acyl-sn-glycerol-3-phosphate acyltransferase [Desulfobacteraceae bacterium]|nr:MAG: 1-acyl-sn-glycerol-3-phosphate acyltransferase [Desulfobacteraceae bacterium]
MERSNLIFNLTQTVSRFILPMKFDIRTEGWSNLPEKGPAFLIPKHQQWWDVPLLGHVVPRPLYFLAKQELFRSSLGRYFISRLGGIPVDRESPIKSLATFRALVSLLQQEAFLVLFPEGTYYPGAMGPGKSRLVQMILRLQNKQALRSVAFIPVGIGYERLSGGRTRVTLRLGEPLQEPDPCRAEDFTGRLLSRVKELSGLQF